jgi:hypothetical protein
MTYLDSNRNNLTYYLWKSAMEYAHVMTKFVNLHAYSCVLYIDKLTVLKLKLYHQHSLESTSPEVDSFQSLSQ